MHTFDTPEPITVSLELESGEVRILAEDRPDTVVQVFPANAARDVDVQFAEQTRVDFANGRLTVRGPKSRDISPLGRWFGRSGAIEIEVTVPAGSRVEARGIADFRCQGPLGDCQISSGTGDVHVDRAGHLRVRTDDGEVTVNAAAGPADITTAHGEIRLGTVEGSASLKTAHGGLTVGEAFDDLRLVTAHGDVEVGRAHRDVTARTASGTLRVGSAGGGTVSLETADGDIEIGIPRGVAAWLDVVSGYGRVHNGLTSGEGPGDGDGVVKVHAITQHGDIHIRRA